MAAMVLAIGLLALPAVVGCLRSNAEGIRKQEHRRQAVSPPITLLFEDARQYIEQVDAYLKDAIGFRLQANTLYRKTRHSILRDPPLPNITLGRNGHIFLNGARHDAPYTYMYHLCVEQGNPPPELLGKLDETLAAANRYFTDQGVQTTVVIFPTTLTLYADKFPLSVPLVYREACLAYPQKDHALAWLKRHGEATGRYRVFYPHALFAAHKKEPYFYPKERYHCEGKSVYLFTRLLLKESGVVDKLPEAPPATLGDVGSDMNVVFGYAFPVTAWVYPYDGQPTEKRHEIWIEEMFGGRPDLLRHDTTKNSLSDKTALIIGNSFGSTLATHLAKAFRHLFFLETNNFTNDQNKADIFAAVAERVRPDYVYFVFDDMNVTNLPQWLAGFVELEKREAARGQSAPPSSPNGSAREKSGL